MGRLFFVSEVWYLEEVGELGVAERDEAGLASLASVRELLSSEGVCVCVCVCV